MTLEEIRTETENDNKCKCIKNPIANGNWEALPHYKKSSREFAEIKNIIIRSNRNMIPRSLRSTVLSIIHKSSLGIAKTKSLLRSKVYWYKMDTNIKNLFKNCLQCQIIEKPQKESPIKMTELPKAPCKSTAADFYGSTSTRKNCWSSLTCLQSLLWKL